MSHIFISYSRKDDTFVDWLKEQLEAGKNRIAWVDRNDSTPADEWWRNIQSAIEEADAFVMLLSPELLESHWCSRELAHALLHRKRLIPLLRRPVSLQAVPPEVAALQWLSAEDASEKLVEGLIRAADADLELIRKHTHWARSSREWEALQRRPTRLLSSETVKEYEGLLPRLDGRRAPAPTELALIYLAESRRRMDRTRRLATAGALAMAGVAILVALSIYSLYTDSRRQERIGTVRRLAAQAQVAVDENRLNRSFLLALASIQRAKQLGTTSVEADQTLRDVLRRMARPGAAFQLSKQVGQLKVSPDGTLLFASSNYGSNDHFIVADLSQARVRAEFPLDPEVERVIDVTFQGRSALWLVDHGIAQYSLFAWSEANPAEVKSLRLSAPDSALAWMEFAFSPNGEFFAAIDDSDHVTIWRVIPHPLRLEKITRAVCTAPGGIASIAFSPDSRQIVIAPGGRTVCVLGSQGAQLFRAGRLVYSTPWEGESSFETTRLTFSENGRLLGAGFDRWNTQMKRPERVFHLWELPEDESLPIQDIGSWSVPELAKVLTIHIRKDRDVVLVLSREGPMEKGQLAYLLPWSDPSLIGQATRPSLFQGGRSPAAAGPLNSGFSSVRLSQEGDAVITANETGVSLWNRELEAEAIRIEEPRFLSAFDARPEQGLFATGTQEGQIRIWHVPFGPQRVDSWEHDAEIITDIASSLDGRMLAVMGHNDLTETLAVWQLRDTMAPGSDSALVHQGDLDGQFIAFAPGEHPGRLMLGDGAGLRRIRLTSSLDGGAALPEALASWPVAALSEEGTVAVSCQKDGGCDVRNLSTGERSQLPSWPEAQWTLNANGILLAVQTGREVLLWRTRSPAVAWQRVAALSPRELVKAHALSSSGGQFAIAMGSQALVWNSITEGMSEQSATLAIRSDELISALAFSRDEQFLAVAGELGAIDVWDLRNKTRAMRFKASEKVQMLHFTRDGRYLVAGVSVELLLYPWRQEALLEDACAWTTYNLSEAEWQQFFPGEDYMEICPRLPRWPPLPTTE